MFAEWPACHVESCGTAGVAQWQSRSFPSLRRGFDSLHPLQHFLLFRDSGNLRAVAFGATTAAPVPDFDNPLQTWTARFARDDFLFGEEPNAFLRREAHRLGRDDSVLCVADGEGRNSVWLAEQGFTVTGFDFAPNAVEKARRLAIRRKVVVDHQVCDIHAWPWSAESYDAVVAIFIQFLPPERREAVFAKMKAAVKRGGLFFLEGYRPEQVDNRTGGPSRRDHMYTRDWLEREFSDWQILVLDGYDAVIGEGDAHKGMSALIDLVARKRSAAS